MYVHGSNQAQADDLVSFEPVHVLIQSFKCALRQVVEDHVAPDQRYHFANHASSSTCLACVGVSGTVSGCHALPVVALDVFHGAVR
eukprot:3377138-Alexandrium_andersonii.AAC.1